MNVRYLFISAVALLAFSSSCNKFLEIGPPVDRMTTAAVFADSSTAEAAVVGLYIEIASTVQTPMNGAATLLPALSADELEITSSAGERDAFSVNFILPQNTYSTGFWTESYKLIYKCNRIIEQLSTSELAITLKKRLSGEAKLLRALHYFYLVNFYGDVPLVVTADYATNSRLTRTGTDRVYALIAADLREAQQLLSADIKDSYRASRWTATALLARVLLFQKRWQEAAAVAGLVIDEGPFSLIPLKNVFLKDSKEAMLQFPLRTSDNKGSADATSFIPAPPSLIPRYHLTETMLHVFEDNDLRKQEWVASTEVNGKIFYYPAKYKIRETTPGSVKPENNTVLRLAELYLIRAEAQARQGNLPAAIHDVDQIRQRAGLPLLADTRAAIGETELLQAIARERQAELFVEWGHRWLDLKRTGKAGAVLAPLKPKWKPTAELYPVPQAEILAAPQLQQNPGY